MNIVSVVALGAVLLAIAAARRTPERYRLPGIDLFHADLAPRPSLVRRGAAFILFVAGLPLLGTAWVIPFWMAAGMIFLADILFAFKE